MIHELICWFNGHRYRPAGTQILIGWGTVPVQRLQCECCGRIKLHGFLELPKPPRIAS